MKFFIINADYKFLTRMQMNDRKEMYEFIYKNQLFRKKPEKETNNFHFN